MDTRSPQQEHEALIDGQRAGILGLGAGLNPHPLGTRENAEWERGRSTTEARHIANAMAKRARTNPCQYRTGDCNCGGRGLCLDVA